MAQAQVRAHPLAPRGCMTAPRSDSPVGFLESWRAIQTAVYVRRHKAKAIDTSTTASANSIQYWPDTPKSANCPTSQASIAAKLHAQADAQLTRGFFADQRAF
jgi:hypothetical protein